MSKAPRIAKGIFLMDENNCVYQKFNKSEALR